MFTCFNIRLRLIISRDIKNKAVIMGRELVIGNHKGNRMFGAWMIGDSGRCETGLIVIVFDGFGSNSVSLTKGMFRGGGLCIWLVNRYRFRLRR